jgi:Carboxylesterase family
MTNEYLSMLLFALSKQPLGSLLFNDGYVDGNYGIDDIVMGLKWVRDHAADFRGSPRWG